MKNLITSIQVALIISITASCSGPKKTAENPAEKPAEISADVKSGQSDVKPDQAEVKSTADAKPKHVSETKTGSQIVSNTTANLGKNLGLSDLQNNRVNDLLLVNFSSIGGSLDKSYQNEEAKSLRQELLQKSKDQISEILDTQQKEKFKTFMLQVK